MKVSNVISFSVSKIIQKKRFVKDILNSIVSQSGRALLVGGAVRDFFLDYPVKDLDFEVHGLSLEQLQKLLERYGVVSLVGKSFGVLRLHGLDVDWSLPRKDSSGRHPIVEYDPNMSYLQAFARRDLTINAMGIDMESFELIDLYGGMQDLEQGVLRATDLDFFVQDPLRLLRVMQFVGRFEMSVDEQLSALCTGMDMSNVSQERIEQEFMKLFLQSKHPSQGLQWLVKIGKFNEFLPGVIVCDELWKKLDEVTVDSYDLDQNKIVMMWAIVASFLDTKQIDKTFEKIGRKEKLPWAHFMKLVSQHKKTITQAVNLVVYAQIVQSELTEVQIKWLAVWFAPELTIRMLSKFIKIRYSQNESDRLLQQAEQIGVADQPEAPLLTGKDFLDVAQGAQIGLLVRKAYQLQIDQGMVDEFDLKKMVM